MSFYRLHSETLKSSSSPPTFTPRPRTIQPDERATDTKFQRTEIKSGKPDPTVDSSKPGSVFQLIKKFDKLSEESDKFRQATENPIRAQILARMKKLVTILRLSILIIHR